MNYAGFQLNSRQAAASNEKENAVFVDIEMLIQMAVRQAKVAAVCVLIGLGLGVVYLQTTPQMYTSFASVLIDDGLDDLAGDDSQRLQSSLQSDSTVVSQIEIIKSSRLASAVVDRLDLDKNDAFLSPPQSLLSRINDSLRSVAGYLKAGQQSGESARTPADAATENQTPEAMRKRSATLILENNIQAMRLGRSFVIGISYEAQSPSLARAITRAYADAFLEDQLNAKFDATARATRWMQGRLDDLRRSSQTAALEVEKYKAENGLTLTKGELMSEQQLTDLNRQLIDAQADTARAQALYQQYKEVTDAGVEDAVNNASIAADQPDSSVISSLRSRYLDVTRRERDISSKFGEDHPQAVLLRKEQADLSRQIFNELKQLTESYRNAYQVALSREKALRDSIAAVRGENTENSQSQVHLRELQQRADALSSLYQAFLARYEQANQQQSFPIGKVRIISDPTLPTRASSPRTLPVMGLSLLLGLMLGGAFAGFNEFNERYFRTGQDVNERLGMKFLGYLPNVGASGSKGKRWWNFFGKAREQTGLPTPAEERSRMNIAARTGHSLFAETLRNAKLAADVAISRKRGKVIGVVSMLPGEGKSTVAANLASLLARNGAKTLLIDADLRKPRLSRHLAPDALSGLVEAILNDPRWQAVAKLDRQNKFAFVPAIDHRDFAHTGELLSSEAMGQFIDGARETFQYIVIDLPPMGPVVDAKAFAPLADGFLVVVEWGQTPRALVRSTLAGEPQIAEKVLGIVLNKVNLKRLGKYASLGGSEHFIGRYADYYAAAAPEGVGEAVPKSPD